MPSPPTSTTPAAPATSGDLSARRALRPEHQLAADRDDGGDPGAPAEGQHQRNEQQPGADQRRDALRGPRQRPGSSPSAKPTATTRPYATTVAMPMTSVGAEGADRADVLALVGGAGARSAYCTTPDRALHQRERHDATRRPAGSPRRRGPAAAAAAGHQHEDLEVAHEPGQARRRVVRGDRGDATRRAPEVPRTSAAAAGQRPDPPSQHPDTQTSTSSPEAASAGPSRCRGRAVTAAGERDGEQRDDGDRRQQRRRPAQQRQDPVSASMRRRGVRRRRTQRAGGPGGHQLPAGRKREAAVRSEDAHVLPQRPGVDVVVVEAGPVLDGGVTAQPVAPGRDR